MLVIKFYQRGPKNFRLLRKQLVWLVQKAQLFPVLLGAHYLYGQCITVRGPETCPHTLMRYSSFLNIVSQVPVINDPISIIELAITSSNRLGTWTAKHSTDCLTSACRSKHKHVARELPTLHSTWIFFDVLLKILTFCLFSLLGQWPSFGWFRPSLQVYDQSYNHSILNSYTCRLS